MTFFAAAWVLFNTAPKLGTLLYIGNKFDDYIRVGFSVSGLFEYCYHVPTAAPGSRLACAKMTRSMTLHQWMHVAVSRSAKDDVHAMNLFIDGQLEASISVPPDVFPSKSIRKYFWIGSHPILSKTTVDGTLHRCAISGIIDR